jgi:hypothetical protein
LTEKKEKIKMNTKNIVNTQAPFHKVGTQVIERFLMAVYKYEDAERHGEATREKCSLQRFFIVTTDPFAEQGQDQKVSAMTSAAPKMR